MTDPVKISIQDLEERYWDALLLSETAVRSRPGAYRELKRLLHEINARGLDVSEYYATALRLTGLLRDLARRGAPTIFDYFIQAIDPCRSGNVRYFRCACLDLADQLTGFDRWRAARRRLTCIK